MIPRAETGSATSRQARAWRWHFGATLLYAALSITILDHGASLAANILGAGSDPFLFTWFLAWWPFALAHHLDPLYTNLVWQPGGLHLAWTTCIPLLALAAAPVTTLFGPVVAYNWLTILAPVLSALACYALCLRLTGKSGPALIGGYLFGFSTYEMAETLEHLNLDFNAAVPCLALVIVARWQGAIGRRRAVACLGVLLAAQFYVSAEIFATVIFFAGIGWLLALGMVVAWRPRLLQLLFDAAGVAPFVLLLILPLLWPMLMQPRDVVIPPGWVFVSSAHLFNLIIPSPDTVLASLSGQTGHDLFGLIPQYDWCAGVPLLIILLLYARRHWREQPVKFMMLMLCLILAASLGPRLWFGDMFTRVSLPWHAMLAVPLISAALPVRFALYSSLIVAVIAALWLAENRSFGAVALAAAACLCMLPMAHPARPLPATALYASGDLEKLVGPHARLLLLPMAHDEPSSLWQAANHFGFAQTQGYLGFPPQTMRFYPAVSDLMFRWKSPHLGADIKQLCLATQTQFIVAGAETPPEMLEAVTQLDWKMTEQDGAEIFTVPDSPAN